MAERSPGEAYEEVLDVLRRHGFAWVAEQVQEQVRAGKPALKDVKPFRQTQPQTPDEPSLLGPRVPGGRREQMAATEPYNPAEQLDVVLGAIESAVIDSAAIEDTLTAFAASETPNHMRFVFAPDDLDRADGFEVIAVRSSRRAGLEKLRLVLEDIRRQNRNHDNR